jgi:hypothetical protein
MSCRSVRILNLFAGVLYLALRRRFSFVELMPDTSVLTEVDGVDLRAVLDRLNDSRLCNSASLSTVIFLSRCSCAISEGVSMFRLDEVLGFCVSALCSSYPFDRPFFVLPQLRDLRRGQHV